MSLIADTHIHLYECYNPGMAFLNLFNNLKKHAAGAGLEKAVSAACLTERKDCDLFDQLESGRWDGKTGDFRIRRAGERGCLRIDSEGGRMFLFAGRQMATSERIEISGLAMTGTVPDGLPACDTVARIIEQGGVPVVPWAVGKWLFARRRVVEGVLSAFPAGRILIGDSSMRPLVWPEPALMKKARESGYTVIAGSDPLPFRGEESALGIYATAFRGDDLNETSPVTSIRRILSAPKMKPELLGNRCGVASFCTRMLRR